MKKFLIIAAAALVALCACTKASVDVPAVPEQEITFQVANYLAQTKADEETEPNYSTYYADGHFGTFAWQVVAGETWNTATSKSVFMDNVEIYSQSNLWKAQKSYYWPKTGSITFASYSPIDSKSACGATASCGTDGIIKVKGWEVETTLADQLHVNADKTDDYKEDLMWADIAADKSANVNTYYTSGVPTLFHHALAKVNLKAKMTETSSASAYKFAIYVTKVKVDGLLYKGDYTVGSSWAPGTERVGDPAIYTNTVSFVGGGTYAEGTDVLGTTAATAVDLIEDYFVLPQTLADASTIEIEYEIVTYDDATKKIILVENTTSDPIKINTMGLTTWDENKNISYTVTIAPTKETPITFDPAVKNWDDVVSDTIKL